MTVRQEKFMNEVTIKLNVLGLSMKNGVGCHVGIAN